MTWLLGGNWSGDVEGLELRPVTGSGACARYVRGELVGPWAGGGEINGSTGRAAAVVRTVEWGVASAQGPGAGVWEKFH